MASTLKTVAEKPRTPLSLIGKIWKKSDSPLRCLISIHHQNRSTSIPTTTSNATPALSAQNLPPYDSNPSTYPLASGPYRTLMRARSPGRS